MRTRSTLAFLFLMLVLVPVGAAIHFGALGVRREQAMLIEAERQAMNRRADSVRDGLVRALEDLHRWELERDTADYLGEARPRRDRIPLQDCFEIDAQGGVRLAGGRKAPGDVAELAQEFPREGPFEAAVAHPGSVSSELRFRGDLVVRDVRLADGKRLLQGFRLEPAAIARHFLDPLSPAAVVPRTDERIDRVELVRDDERTRLELKMAHDLPLTLYRHLIPSGREEERPLAPPGFLLLFTMRPVASLEARLGETETRTVWTLGAVALVVAAGLVFAWRAVRAESLLAERKTDFVSAVSHELRTPLTSIRMYADLLKEGWVKDEQTARDYFGLISAESERLARLVNNVLDFSRLERGRKTFEMKEGDVARVVRDTAEMLAPYLRAKGFELVVDLPESLPQCRFDKDALTQILVNLIDNAVKYGDKEVRIEAEAMGPSLEIRVHDRGSGVRESERESIFEPFQRGTNGSAGGGSGLGLALVRRYARAHGGDAKVTPREGGGSTFTVSLQVDRQGANHP